MSEQSGYSLSDADAGTFWYVRINGKQDGPLSTGRIRQLARQDKLLPEDQVRLGTLGAWVNADEVSGLYQGIQTTTRAELAAAEEKRAREAKEEADHRSAPSGGWGETLTDWTNEVIGWVGGSWELVRLTFSWICLGIVVVTQGLLIGRNISWDWWESRLDGYATLTTEWSELKSLRENRATEQQWQEFSTTSRGRLAPLISQLEANAGADDRYSQQLLWAARDVWPLVLAEARNEPNEAEEQFENHLENAQTIRAGHPLYPSAARTGGPADLSSNIFWRLYGDWITAGIVLIDGLLLLMLLRWLWKRTRSG